MPALDSSKLVGIVGAGTMGTGIAQLAAMAGHPVRLHDAEEGAAAAALDAIGQRLERELAKGRLDRAGLDAALGRLEVAERLDGLAGAGLVIEAIVEELEAKRRLMVELERVVGADAILASNTSSISITAIAAGLAVPERALGMHFFNPAPVMALVEVVSGLATSEEVCDSAAATVEAWGKTPVRVRSTPGFIVNRVARPFYGEALRLLGEGATDAATLDAVYRECGGFAMGPLALSDLIGQDVNLAVTRTVFEAFHHDRRYEPSLIQEELVAAGRLGRKVGRGFFAYGEHAPAAGPQALARAAPPRALFVEGDVGPLWPLVALAREHGIVVERERFGRGYLSVGDLAMTLTDGRLAAEHMIDADRPLVLLDLCLDYRAAPRIALAWGGQLDEAAVAPVIGFFQAIGKEVSVLRDLPGLVVMRTVAMLANEAADAVHFGVATSHAIDLAMQKGLHFPKGPMAWGRDIGLDRVVQVIDNLRRLYGEDRYRVSIEFHRRATLERARA